MSWRAGLWKKSSAAHLDIRELSWTLELLTYHKLTFLNHYAYEFAIHDRQLCLLSPPQNFGKDLGMTSSYLRPHCHWFLGCVRLEGRGLSGVNGRGGYFYKILCQTICRVFTLLYFPSFFGRDWYLKYSVLFCFNEFSALDGKMKRRRKKMEAVGGIVQVFFFSLINT